MEHAPVITNVKISFKLASERGDVGMNIKKCRDTSLKKLKGKEAASFFICRSLYVYTIFYRGHVNCTGLRSWGDVVNHRGQQHLLHLLNCDNQLFKVSDSYTVDNISASGVCRNRPPFRLPLEQLTTDMLRNMSPLIRLQYSREIFAGATVKTEWGTLLIFDTWKYVFVGVKQISHLDRLYNNLVKGIFKEFLTTR